MMFERSERESLARLLERERPLLLPVAHDAFSARLIERAGFKAIGVGGFGIIACKLGIPDLGLASFGEVRDAVREIVACTGAPIFVDADEGYGDVKNVVRTTRTYEEMGAAGIILEDQASPKKCGHMRVERRLVAMEDAVDKLHAAVSARKDPNFSIIARTDARSVEGLDAALARADRYAACGVDALFVEAPTSLEELKTIGSRFDLPLIVNAAEGGQTPLLTPAGYAELGFSIILYPATLLIRMHGIMSAALDELRTGRFARTGYESGFDELTEIVGLPEWMELDRQLGIESSTKAGRDGRTS